MADEAEQHRDTRPPGKYWTPPDYAYLSRWFRGPPAATTRLDSALAVLGAILLACAAVGVILRRMGF